MPNNHLHQACRFSKASARDCLPRSGAVAAWHAVCGSQSLLTVAPVSFYQPPSVGNAVRYPACTKPAPAWTFCPLRHRRPLAKSTMLHEAPAKNAHFPFILIPSANKSPRATRCLCSPAKPTAALRFLLHTPACICMPPQKSALCDLFITFSRSPQPFGTRSEIAHTSLIRFRASRTVIAMKILQSLLLVFVYCLAHQ